MRTTLTLEPDVVARLKQEVRRTGHSFKQVVNELLRRGLVAPDKPAPVKRFVIKSRPMGLRRGLSYDNIGELLEQAEGPGYK